MTMHHRHGIIGFAFLFVQAEGTLGAIGLKSLYFFGDEPYYWPLIGDKCVDPTQTTFYILKEATGCGSDPVQSGWHGFRIQYFDADADTAPASTPVSSAVRRQ